MGSMGRNIFMGCAFVAVVLVAGLVALFWVKGARLFQSGRGWVKEQVAESRRISEVEQGWQPPSAEPDWQWFPTGFERWFLIKTLQEPGWGAAGMERPLTRAIYKRGADVVEVRVFAVAAGEKEDVFKQAETKLASGARSQFNTRTANRFYLRVNGREHTRLWWIKGWLFVFSSQGAEDPEPFMNAYLQAMRDQKPPELDCCPGEPVPAESR